VPADVYNRPLGDWRAVSIGGRNASTGGKDVRGDRGGSINGEGRTHRVRIDVVPTASKADDEIATGITSVSYAGSILLGGGIENDEERRDTRVFLLVTLPTTLCFINDFRGDLTRRGG
jgi:hypothetical protein